MMKELDSLILIKSNLNVSVVLMMMIVIMVIAIIHGEDNHVNLLIS